MEASMKYVTKLAFAASVLMGSLAVAQPYTAPASALAHVAVETDARVKLMMDMRKLWEDHITWTRVYIIDALAGLPDTDAASQRLLRNQEDIGAAIKPYYGDAAGTKLTGLLKDHIMIATEVVKAAKAGDNAQVATQQKRWSANADDIAAFLSGANPNWQRDAVRDMLQKHLDFTTQETVARLKKDWPADIRAYDENHNHMLMFSDMLSDGIVRQFSQRFAAR
jgi:hypothetical protein